MIATGNIVLRLQLEHGLAVERLYTGSSMTFLNMAGFSISQQSASIDKLMAFMASREGPKASVSSYCIFLDSSVLTWKSKKHAAVSRSSTEAELRALATTTSEIIWLRWLLADFGVPCDDPTPFLYDNTGAIQIANDPVKHELTEIHW
ncbi:retrovirus-related pol polyprotein fromtransposon TNT 1-94 [Striga asiatica]|uniref:Retrovirus-related pol polyprotein fromtransposon TNT 1-94 n=1 Tax=Striga asiatica TaxID=4170 RepID=A0A5A7Q2G5_STRAF|nr:retrovirus-related pol polyprotein fromtransposon TNT 1-94 [Striga asiatica]